MAANKKDMEYLLSQARRIAEHREAGAEKEIRKLYKSTLKDLKAFISNAYEMYAKDDSLTYADLQKAGYDARFLEEIEQRMGVATQKAARELNQLVSDTYKLAYDGMVDAVNQGGNLEEAFAGSIAITPEQIKNVVNNPIMETALQKNHAAIIYDIKQVVAVGLMNGDRYTTMARRISEKVDGAFFKSVRIARTEAHRVREAGELDAGLQVDEALQKGTTGLRLVKKWKTMQDERVRPQVKRGKKIVMRGSANHIALNGQIRLMDEPFDLGGGVTAMAPGQSRDAANDINCRCKALKKMMTDEEYFAATGKHFPSKQLEIFGNSGIMKAEEMQRRKGNDYVAPMPKKQLQKIVKGFKRSGGIIQMNDATDEYLRSKNAEAITIDAKTILLKQRSGRAAVFEELIHATQFRIGANDGTLKARLQCEIAAQEKLLRYQKAYKLTDAEIRQTAKALEAYKKELEDYLKKG